MKWINIYIYYLIVTVLLFTFFLNFVDRELSVLVEPRETGQVEMLVSYVVNRCGWKPAYDIRIFNNDGTMKVSSFLYY